MTELNGDKAKMADDFSGKVETVLGSVHSSELGETLTHEHLISDFYKPYTYHYTVPLDVSPALNIRGLDVFDRVCRSRPITSDDASHITLHEVHLFQLSGGKTIVDNTSHGLYRDLHLLKRISAATKVNVIVGTGFYIGAVNPSFRSMTIEDMYHFMREELENGCIHDSSVKAGFVGEVGTVWPILAQDFEKRSICATGELQEQLHCPVSFHPGLNSEAPLEIMRFYQEAGGKSSKAVMSHVDRTLSIRDKLWDFIDDNKCYVQFDMFGKRGSSYHLDSSIISLTDKQRIKRIALLKKEKELHRVLMSHNIQGKRRMASFNGHGYTHITQNIVPKMITKYRFSLEDIETLRVENPKRWLTKY